MSSHQNQKLQQLIAFDKDYRQSNICIIGIDEAGRGPLCGPLVAAAIVLPYFSEQMLETFKYLNDSKQFSGVESRREELFDNLIKTDCTYAIEEGSLEDIEEYNIYHTTYLTMYKAYKKVVKKLGKNKKHIVLVDGTKVIGSIPDNIKQHAIVKGDAKSASIAAASILAKVHRDRYMCEISKEYPEYNWNKNKGYATAEHIEAIRKHGRCKYHRMSFKIKGLDYVAV